MGRSQQQDSGPGLGVSRGSWGAPETSSSLTVHPGCFRLSCFRRARGSARDPRLQQVPWRHHQGVCLGAGHLGGLGSE